MYWPDDPYFGLSIVKEGRLRVVFDQERGYLYFVDNSELKGIDEFLDELASIGLLQMAVEDNNVLVNEKLPIYETLTCPECGSPFVSHETLAQHDRCGTVLPVALFEREGHLFCPACNAEIKQEELIDLGTWYICHSCGSRFQFPTVRFNRGEDKAELGTEKVVYKKSYALTPRGISALAAPPSQLREALKKGLYQRESIFFVGSFYGSISHAEEVEVFFEYAHKPHQVLVLKANSKITELDLKSAIDTTKSNLYDTEAIVITPTADKNALQFLKNSKLSYEVCDKEEKLTDVILGIVKARRTTVPLRARALSL
ncbi:MAG: hypothetical protein RXR41_00240 [Candidatus Marsarchaeota archaeon]